MPRRQIPDPRISELIQQENWEQVRDLIAQFHPADIADVIDRAPQDSHEKIFSLLPDDLKPDVLAELEEGAEIDILEALSVEEISEIVEEMAPDDAADIIADLPEERSSRILDLMEKEESEDVRELLKYDEESAGGIMTTDVVSMKQNQTVEAALNTIASMDPEDKFVYTYIVDDSNVLTGSVNIWEMLHESNKQKRLGELIKKDFVAANVNIDQEEAVHLINQYDLNAVPVIDDDGKLLGRITADDVIDVMEDEASEDIFIMAGSDDQELDNYSAVKRSMVRLPWILITLFGGLLIALILKAYQSHINNIEILVAYIPSILALGGNTGIQSSTLVVRRIALGTLKSADVGKLLGREILTGMIMGIICGAIIGTGAYLIGIDAEMSLTPLHIAGTVGFSLFCAMTFATTFGALVPVLLKRIDVDPAIASGPFITITNDIAALLIYFAITAFLLQDFIQ